jgi:hypothetical protein
MQKSLYGIWLIITLFTTALILFLRHRRTQSWNLTLNETIELALSNFGGISGGYLIYQSYSLYDSLSKLVGNEGIIAMFLGGLASVWFAFGKVKELIQYGSVRLLDRTLSPLFKGVWGILTSLAKPFPWKYEAS